MAFAFGCDMLFDTPIPDRVHGNRVQTTVLINYLNAKENVKHIDHDYVI